MQIGHALDILCSVEWTQILCQWYPLLKKCRITLSVLIYNKIETHKTMLTNDIIRMEHVHERGGGDFEREGSSCLLLLRGILNDERLTCQRIDTIYTKRNLRPKRNYTLCFECWFVLLYTIYR